MAVIFFIFAAGLFYVNKILLPIQVKGMAIQAATDALKRNVSFDSLQYSPLRGFVITNLIITEKNDPSRTFVRAKNASAQILFFALLQKKLIIPSLRIESPEIVITRTRKDLWNFSDLLPGPGSAGNSASTPPLDVIISGFTMTGGHIIVNDPSLEDNFSEEINVPQIKGSLSLKGAFNISGDISLPATQGSLKFDTRIGIQDQSFKGTFKAKNININRYLRFSPSDLPVKIQNLMLADAEVSALLEGKNANLSADMTLPALNITLSDGTKIQGDITLSKVLASMSGANISVHGSLYANKFAAETSTGLTLNMSTLRTANAQMTIKENLLTASGDLDARDMDLVLNTDQKIKASVNISALTVTQNTKGYGITGEIKADDVLLMLGKDQSLSGNATLKKMSALIEGSAIEMKTDVDIKGAALNLPGTSVKTDITAPGTRLNFDAGRLETELRAAFKDLSLKTQNMSVSGASNAPELTAHVILDPKSALPLSYTGTLKLADLAISGVPQVGEIKDIRGEITFKTESAATDTLTFTVLNTPVNINGEISNFQNPKINASATINKADLSLIEKLIPELIKDQGLTIKGTAAINATFSGSLAKIQEAQINANAKLTDASVESKKLNQSVSSINGLVEYKTPVLSWKDLSVRYQNKAWTSHGSLQDFINPIISATVETENLTANIEAKKKDSKVQLTSLSGTYFDSTYELIGDIFLPEGQSPNIDINGEFKLSLRDLPKMLPPEQAKQIEALQLAGILKIKTQLKGTPQDWPSLTSTTSIETPALYMLGYQIADLNINAQQKNGEVNPLTINGKLYGGDLNTTSTVMLKEKGFPFTAKAKLDNTSLELLKKDTPLKQQQLSGLVFATADLKGNLMDIRSMQGGVTMKISHGYLWSLEILSKVLSILSSTFQGGDVIITDADATFKIIDQKIMTDNLTLRSATVTLVAEGWVDFDQNIELNIRPRIEPKSSDGTTNPLTMINPTDGLVNIRVYNTLTAPKFEHNISAPQMIKKTIQNTVGTFLKMFE